MLGVLTSAIFTTHSSAGSGQTGPSGRITSSLAGVAAPPDGGLRLFKGVEEDFAGSLSAGAGATGELAGMSLYKDGGSVATVGDEPGGVLRIVTGAADNDETSLVSGPVGQLTPELPLTMEARLSVPASGTLFVGLRQPGAAAANLVADNDELPSEDRIGFLIVNGAAKFVCRKNGAAAVELADLGNLAAGYHRLGFIFGRRDNSTQGLCDVFTDNKPQTAIAGSKFPAATTPLGVLMSAAIGVKNTAAAATTVNIDWVYAYSMMR